MENFKPGLLLFRHSDFVTLWDYCLKENIPFINYDRNDMDIAMSSARDCQHHGESENTYIANKVIERLDK